MRRQVLMTRVEVRFGSNATGRGKLEVQPCPQCPVKADKTKALDTIINKGQGGHAHVVPIDQSSPPHRSNPRIGSTNRLIAVTIA
jgi:hypothetical protein